MMDNLKILNKLIEYTGLYLPQDDIHKVFEKHPNPDSLKSIIDTLNEVGMQNATISLEFQDFNRIHDLPTPFIAHLQEKKEHFVVVKNVKSDVIEFFSINSGEVIENWTSFKDKWTGVALSIFPDSSNLSKKEESVHSEDYIKTLFYSLTFLLFVACNFIFIESTNSFFYSFTFTIKLIGLMISILLLQNEYDSSESILSRLCSSKQSDCNKILNSQKAKLFNLVSWSELGFLYFGGGLLSLTLNLSSNISSITTILFILNIPTLFFSFYSVWYQYLKAKSWCRFCLITLTLFWIEALLFMNFISVFSFDITLNTVVLTLIGFGIPIVILYFTKPTLKKLTELNDAKSKFNNIKFNTQVVELLLNKNETKIIGDSAAINIYGENESLNNITIVTSPTCSPCASTHKKIEKYLNNCYDINLNIIFSINLETDLGTDKYKVARKIIQVFKSQGSIQALVAMKNWYDNPTKSYEKWNIAFPCDDLNVNDVLSTQYRWCEKNKIQYTPTIFLNERELHEFYDVTDLKYIL